MGRIEREDEEIIRRIQAGEQELTDDIMDKYKYLVKKKAKALYILGGDNDTLNVILKHQDSSIINVKEVL